MPSWISDQNDFSYFDLLITPMLPNMLQNNLSFVSGEVAKNRFQDGSHEPIGLTVL